MEKKMCTSNLGVIDIEPIFARMSGRTDPDQMDESPENVKKPGLLGSLVFSHGSKGGSGGSGSASREGSSSRPSSDDQLADDNNV
jgi:hypothetical protein